MKYVVAIAVLLCGLFVAPLLQGTLMYRAAPGGVNVDLVFVLTISVGFVFGSLAGSVSGLLGGFALGTACGDLAGLLGAVYGVLGALAGFLPWQGLRTVVPGALVAMFLTFGLLAIEFIALRESEAPSLALRPALLLALYNGLLTMPVSALLSLLRPRHDALRHAVVS